MWTASVSHRFADEPFQQLWIDLLLLLAVRAIEALDFTEPLHEVVRHCMRWKRSSGPVPIKVSPREVLESPKTSHMLRNHLF